MEKSESTVSVHPTAIVEEGAEIGEGTRVWHFAHVRTGAIIGAGCMLGKGVFVDSGVRIGDCVRIQNNVSVYHGVSLGKGVFVGPHVCFTNDLNPRAVTPQGDPKKATDWQVAATRIEEGASIGANATIVAGITIGAWSMIGAGSVVTRNVPPYGLVRGNPARLSGVVSRAGNRISRIYAPGSHTDLNTGEVVLISEEWVSECK